MAREYRLSCCCHFTHIPKIGQARYYPELLLGSYPVGPRRLCTKVRARIECWDVSRSPSEPNYVASISGDFWGLGDDNVRETRMLTTHYLTDA